MVTVGFLGLGLLVFHTRGSFGTFNPFLLIAASAGVLVAVTGIAMHALAGRGTVTYSTAFYGVVVVVGTLPLVVGEWIDLTSVTLWLLLGTGVGFTIRAYTLQLSNYLLQPYIVAVLAYTGVVFSAIGDWVFFNHLPSLLQFVGMVIIAISGGAVVWIESRATRSEHAHPPRPGE
jgi:drug/metabolite transporter (DMT)-like permease